MTLIDFHTHIPGKLSYACRLIRKIYLSKNKVIVLASSSVLAELDSQLWVFSALEFIPHCYADHALRTQSPVVLAESLIDVPHHQVLLNLSTELPSAFARFERVLEVAGDESTELEEARVRYRFYRDRGYGLKTYRYSEHV